MFRNCSGASGGYKPSKPTENSPQKKQQHLRNISSHKHLFNVGSSLKHKHIKCTETVKTKHIKCPGGRETIKTNRNQPQKASNANENI